MIASTTRTIAKALFAAWLAACGVAGAQTPLVVGVAVSQTGAHADLAADYGRGIELWRDEANAGGGVLGRAIDLRLHDDASDAARTGALYRELIRDKVDALIGPFGTAATLVAAAEAESAQRVMVNGAGWSRAVHKRAPRYVFQSAVPYNAYGTPVLELARNAGMRSALILARDDPGSLEMAAAAVDAAKRLGLAAGEPQVYGAGTADFVAIIAKAHASGVEAWLAFGGVEDAAEMLKGFKKARYAPRLAFLRAAADPKLVDLVGQDAEFSMGAAVYHPQRPGAAAFAEAFEKKWQRRPGAAAAEGYAAGLGLAAGLRRAGSAEPRALRAALAALEIETPVGRYKVDPATGEQLAAGPVVVQRLQGRAQIVAPEGVATVKPVLPYPDWEARQVLK
jgi:branched-chain amino acid transport system substrate-binding protein